MKYWAHYFLFSLSLQYSSTTVCAQVAYVEAVDLKGKFQTTMCLILVGLTSVGLLMLMLSIYIRHCTEHFNSGGHTVTDHCTPDFNREIIDKCPVFPYSTIKDLKIGRGTLECAVCLTEFEDTDNVRFLPKCNHVFHQDCIDVWLQSHMNCPVCRSNLTSDVVSIDIPNHEEGQSSRNNVVVIGEAEVEPDSDSTDGDGDGDGTGVEVVNVVSARESRMLEKLPRSHSTGHSLEEKYTLRLPEEVRKNILGNHGRMRSSDGVILPGEWSGKNVERWSLSMSPTCWMPVVCQGASTSTLPV